MSQPCDQHPHPASATPLPANTSRTASGRTLPSNTHKPQPGNQTTVSRSRDQYLHPAFATLRTAPRGDPQSSPKRVLAGPSSGRDPKRQRIDTSSGLSCGDNGENSDNDSIVDWRRHQTFLDLTNDGEDPRFSSDMSDGLDTNYNQNVEDEGQDDMEKEGIWDLMEDEQIAM